MFGVRVKEFMLGLPGPSIGFRRRETRYGITCVPLGGYANIAGMLGGPENPNLDKAAAFLAYFGSITFDQVTKSSEKLGFDLEEALYQLEDWGTVVRRRDIQGVFHFDMAQSLIDGKLYKQGEARQIGEPKQFIAAERKLTYRSLSWWKRMVVLVAGAAFNLFFAVLVFTLVMLFIGQSVPTTTVNSVVEDSPAMAAGIAAGDKLVSIDGVGLESWADFTNAIALHSPGDTLTIGFEHEGTLTTASLELGSSDGRAIVGVTSLVVNEPIPITDAIGTAFGFIGFVFMTILQLFNPATFSETIAQSSSVVGVSVEARNAADAGFLPFIILTAALSISIGLMNLLPIPPLDGGKMVVETIQKIFRREISTRVVSGISVAGVALLLVLFIVCTSQDIQRYFLGG
jgi:regulator of sigma E protease